jgi:predicted secreted hydrolase
MFSFNGGSGPKYAIHHSRPTEAIALFRDDAAHYWAHVEWWYYTGRLLAEDGRLFGFELTFFKRITTEDRFILPFISLPVRWFKDVGIVSHFAVTDLGQEKISCRLSQNFLKKWKASPEVYDVAVGNWFARKEGTVHHLAASMKGYSMDLSLTPTKPPALHGPGGIVRKAGENANYYYSYTNMEVTGSLTVSKKTLAVKGKAWMDHEYGTIHIGMWDWFSLRLDDETELMINIFRDIDQAAVRTIGTWVDREGNTLHLSEDDMRITPVESWKSKKTDACYPVSWRIGVASLYLDLDVRAIFPRQEMIIRPLAYWEGMVDVSGEMKGAPITGHGYCEMVGYSKKNMAYRYYTFDFANVTSP